MNSFLFILNTIYILMILIMCAISYHEYKKGYFYWNYFSGDKFRLAIITILLGVLNIYYYGVSQ